MNDNELNNFRSQVNFNELKNYNRSISLKLKEKFIKSITKLYELNNEKFKNIYRLCIDNDWHFEKLFLINSMNKENEYPNILSDLLIPLLQLHNILLEDLEKHIRKVLKNDFKLETKSLFGCYRNDFVSISISSFEQYFIHNYLDTSKTNLLFNFDYLDITLGAYLTNLKKIQSYILPDVPLINVLSQGLNEEFSIDKIIEKIPQRSYISGLYNQIIDEILLSVLDLNMARSLIIHLYKGISIVNLNTSNNLEKTLENYNLLDLIHDLKIPAANISQDLKTIGLVKIIHLRQFYDELEILIFFKIYNRSKSIIKVNQSKKLQDFSRSILNKKSHYSDSFRFEELKKVLIRSCIRGIVCGDDKIKSQPLFTYLYQDHLYTFLSNTNEIKKILGLKKSIFNFLGKELETHKISLGSIFEIFFIIFPNDKTKAEMNSNRAGNKEYLKNDEINIKLEKKKKGIKIL